MEKKMSRINLFVVNASAQEVGGLKATLELLDYLWQNIAVPVKSPLKDVTIFKKDLQTLIDGLDVDQKRKVGYGYDRFFQLIKNYQPEN